MQYITIQLNQAYNKKHQMCIQPYKLLYHSAKIGLIRVYEIYCYLHIIEMDRAATVKSQIMQVAYLLDEMDDILRQSNVRKIIASLNTQDDYGHLLSMQMVKKNIYILSINYQTNFDAYIGYIYWAHGIVLCLSYIAESNICNLFLKCLFR